MIRINHLPVRAAQKKERLRAQLSILVLSLLAVSVACGAEYFRMMSKIDSQKKSPPVAIRDSSRRKCKRQC